MSSQQDISVMMQKQQPASVGSLIPLVGGSPSTLLHQQQPPVPSILSLVATSPPLASAGFVTSSRMNDPRLIDSKKHFLNVSKTG